MDSYIKFKSQSGQKCNLVIHFRKLRKLEQKITVIFIKMIQR